MENILEVRNISKSYIVPTGIFYAVKNVSLYIRENEAVGLVGGSGCGKSTLAKLIVRLETPDTGVVSICGDDIGHLAGKKLRAAYMNVKMIFQDPRSSFDPQMTLGASICLAVRASRHMTASECENTAKSLLVNTGLDSSYYSAYPRNISGGECQRAAIARAIATKPRLIICDEATSALDVSVQAMILKLLHDLKSNSNVSFLFISHDIALVNNFCERVYVMNNGEIIEHGSTKHIINEPCHDYTKKLISSVLPL